MYASPILFQQEVEMYKHHLVDKPALLALNKIDCDHDGSIVKDIIERIKSLPGKPSSSLSSLSDLLT